MKSIAVLFVLAALCCTIASAAPLAGRQPQRRVAARPSLKYAAMRRSSPEAAVLEAGKWTRRPHRIVRPPPFSYHPSIRAEDAASAAQLTADDPALNEIVPPTVDDEAATAAEEAAVPAATGAGKDIETADDDDAVADDADDDEAQDEPAFVPPAFVGKQPHTFFAMNFGRTKGGAVAVANSFSTGKGTAVSHAVAHGTARRH